MRIAIATIVVANAPMFVAIAGSALKAAHDSLLQKVFLS
jgi:short chain dehydrogenase